MSTPDHFRRLAVLALRLVALLVLVFAARSAIYFMLFDGAELGMLGKVDAVVQGGAESHSGY